MPRRVLIADDNDTVRNLIRSFLRARGNIEVCAETSDGQATINLALAMQPDLLILDVVMPEPNGLEVAEILKKRLPNTKMVLFTMYGESIKSLALVAGVHAILPKPDGILELIAAVESALSTGQVATQHEQLSSASTPESSRSGPGPFPQPAVNPHLASRAANGTFIARNPASVGVIEDQRPRKPSAGRRARLTKRSTMRLNRADAGRARPQSRLSSVAPRRAVPEHELHNRITNLDKLVDALASALDHESFPDQPHAIDLVSDLRVKIKATDQMFQVGRRLEEPARAGVLSNVAQSVKDLETIVSSKFGVDLI